MPINVGIVGGGIGGLCLAQGLHAAGVKVTVYERDRSRTDRLQGFRIHIDPNGSQALYDCLPTETWNTFIDTCGLNRGGFQMGDEQLRPWLEFKEEDMPAQTKEGLRSHKSISRITLRQVLLLGLDDIVQFGKEFKEYEVEGDRVLLRFADGSTAEHDVVVGADGTGSRIRKLYLPGNDPEETGVMAIAGKAPLNENNEDLTTSVVYGPKGLGWFMARHQMKRNNAALPAGVGVNDAAQMQSHEGFLFDNTKDYFFWALIALKEKFSLPEDTKEGTARLKTKAMEMTETWHPRLGQLIKDTEIDTLSIWNIKSSKPTPAWTTTRVTLLGDAIHAMPPTGGVGANTALRDAALLKKKLIEANGDEKPVLQAIQEYEVGMRDYAYAIVSRSRHTMQTMIEEDKLKRGFFSWILWTVNLTPRFIKRWFMARDWRK